MLGWDVYVRPVGEQVASVASWTARLGMLTTMEQLVERGDAVEVSMHGGYPNVYRVKASVIQYWCEDSPPEMCKMWTGTGYSNWELLDALQEGDWVELEMWDGS